MQSTLTKGQEGQSWPPFTDLTLLVCQLMRSRTLVQHSREPVCMWKVGDYVEVVLLHPHRKWAVSLCWGCGCGGMTLTSLCAFWCCRVALFVDFRWATAVVSQVFIDNRQEHDGTVVGVSWPLPSGTVIGSTSNEHFPASATTPLQWTWCIVQYLVHHMDIFYVV